MSEEAGECSDSDAWILASLRVSGKGMSLSTLIGSADAHNHSIPTRAELASALGNLIAAGLAEKTKRGFRITKQGEALNEHWLKSNNMFEWINTLLPHLQKLPFPGVEYPLTDAERDKAYAAYSRRFAAWYSKQPPWVPGSSDRR